MVLLLSSVMSFASRYMATVNFTLLIKPKSRAVMPFSAVVPATYAGPFVRFVHARSGKSVVAEVTKATGTTFRTSKGVAEAIGITKKTARVRIEEIY